MPYREKFGALWRLPQRPSVEKIVFAFSVCACVTIDVCALDLDSWVCQHWSFSGSKFPPTHVYNLSLTGFSMQLQWTRPIQSQCITKSWSRDSYHFYRLYNKTPKFILIFGQFSPILLNGPIASCQKNFVYGCSWSNNYIGLGMAVFCVFGNWNKYHDVFRFLFGSCLFTCQRLLLLGFNLSFLTITMMLTKVDVLQCKLLLVLAAYPDERTVWITSAPA